MVRRLGVGLFDTVLVPGRSRQDGNKQLPEPRTSLQTADDTNYRSRQGSEKDCLTSVPIAISTFPDYLC
jgi:hypothetical protein